MRRTRRRSLGSFTQTYCLGYRRSSGHKSNIIFFRLQSFVRSLVGFGYGVRL